MRTILTMGPMVHRKYYFGNSIVTNLQRCGTNGSSILLAQGFGTLRTFLHHHFRASSTFSRPEV